MKLFTLMGMVILAIGCLTGLAMGQPLNGNVLNGVPGDCYCVEPLTPPFSPLCVQDRECFMSPQCVHDAECQAIDPMTRCIPETCCGSRCLPACVSGPIPPIPCTIVNYRTCDTRPFVPCEVFPIPTLGQWGLILFGMLLLTMMYLTIRRRGLPSQMTARLLVLLAVGVLATGASYAEIQSNRTCGETDVAVDFINDLLEG